VRWLCDAFDGRIVFPSTCSVYGAQDGELDEQSALEPLSLYAQTKVEAERVLAARRPDSLILRLATLAGVGDTYSRIRLDLVLNLLVMRAKLVGELQVFGGNQYRPLLHVRDVATAVVPHLQTEAAGIFNLGSGRAATFNAVATVTINACRAAEGAPVLPFEELHRSGAIEYVGFPPGLASRYQSFTQADLGRLRAAGYKSPMTGVEQGVPNCVRALLALPQVNP
jgi:nucleoside-diphosphate-sugar epimerase